MRWIPLLFAPPCLTAVRLEPAQSATLVPNETAKHDFEERPGVPLQLSVTVSPRRGRGGGPPNDGSGAAGAAAGATSAAGGGGAREGAPARLSGGRQWPPREIDWDFDSEESQEKARAKKERNVERIIGPIRSLMSQLDQTLVRTRSRPLQAALDKACQKLDIETRQLLRNTQRNLLDVEESLSSLSAGSPGKPGNFLTLLSTFLDREAWLVNATVHSLMHSCTNLVVFLPRKAKVKTQTLVGMMANVVDQLMEPVQDELERVRQAAAQPDPCDQAASLAAQRRNDTGAGAVLRTSSRSFATSLKGEFALASRRKADRRLAPFQEKDMPSGMSSPFMKRAEEIIVAGVKVMDTLQLTFKRLMEENIMRDDDCEDAFLEEDPEQEALAEQREYNGAVERLSLPRQALLAAASVALLL